MELVLAILMGLGIFLVIPVIIGLSTIGIYLLNRRRVLNTEKGKLLKDAAADIENIIGETEYNQVSGLSADEKNKDYVKSK
ncbi:MAG: hypothetical protein JW762_11915 [Dehalococcoidales bacterium]|nr:hypothetical protein [Dehalococcoidales bacterium]